jgi:hypothetical protein
MRLGILVLVFCFFVSSYINAQVSEKNHVRHNITLDTVIYEVDTVYMPPDTIRIADTIRNNPPRTQSVEKTTNKIQYVAKKFSNQWSLGFHILPFISNLFNNISPIDSFSFQKVVNYSYDINIQCGFKNYVIGIGAGITPLHERMNYQGSHGATSAQDALLSYDSLQIANNCTSDNYYNYFNLYLTVGRKWTGKKIDFGFNASFITDLLMDYKAVLPLSSPFNNQINSSSVRKLGFSAAISPYLGFKFGKTMALILAPFYKYSFSQDHKFPQNNFQNIGISAGLNIFL